MNERIKNFSNSYKVFKEKLIKRLEKPVSVCKVIFGYGIMISLFVGGLTLLGYIIALCIGGEAAAQICSVIKAYIIPAVTYVSTVMVLFGIIIMYLSGQTALSAKKKIKKEKQPEEEEKEEAV